MLLFLKSEAINQWKGFILSLQDVLKPTNNTALIKNIMAWVGRGSVDKVLTVQAYGSEFGFPATA